MSVIERTISYGPDGTYSGYAAFIDRNTTSLPAIVVLQEIWGVDDHIKDVTRRFAKAGYYALAPDLYSVQGKRLPVYERDRIEAVKTFLNSVPPVVWHDQEKLVEALDGYPPSEAKEILETLNQLFAGNKPENYREQLTATSQYLRTDEGLTRGQPVGSVGFCMGGALSALLAGADSELRGAIVFYGRPPEEGVIRSIGCPVLGFYGETDGGITPKIPEVADKMKASGKEFEYHVFEGAGHAFFNDTRASYNPEAARTAFARSLSFFAAHLAPDTRMERPQG